MATAGKRSDNTRFTQIRAPGRGYYLLIAVLGVFAAAGLWAAHTMDVQGHHITGMNNQIVWGIPHVFAVFLIVTASGALNGATLSSVMGRRIHSPYARLSALLAIALLLGGLAVITLDLGRPDRLAIALTHFNMRSVFAWNVFFYTGFLALAVLYLWTLMERRKQRFIRPVSMLMLAWRLSLTTATGLIFGVLAARQAYDAAIMAPLFIAMSLSFGTAAYLLLLLALPAAGGRRPEPAVVDDSRRLLALFIVAVLLVTAVLHAVKLYAPEYRAVERFLLVDGGAITVLLWAGQIAAGSLLPLWLLLWRPGAASRPRIAAACALVLLGGLAQVTVIVIGGQAFPLAMFPGKVIIESSFFDGAVVHYRPTLVELALALGGVATALLMTVLGMKVLPFLPARGGQA